MVGNLMDKEHLEQQISTLRFQLNRTILKQGPQSEEVRALQEQLAVFLEEKRNSLEGSVVIGSLPQQPIELPAVGPGGLTRLRYPNRSFFLCDFFDYALKGDHASMEAPIFTLSTNPDLAIWHWKSQDGKRSVTVTPSVLGRATQHDKDVLIFLISQLTESLNRKDVTNRVTRFNVYDFLETTNRGSGGDDYRRLQAAFERLAGTRLTTDIQTGGVWIKEGFGLIDRWRIIERSPTDTRMMAVEVTLSEWIFNAVQAHEVLTLHTDYFRLRKPIARRLYELARKHCGHQAQWAIRGELLKEKTGSQSTPKEFYRALRQISDMDGGLPDYRFTLDDLHHKVTFYPTNTKAC